MEAHTLPHLLSSLTGIVESLSNQFHYKCVLIFLETHGLFKLIKNTCLEKYHESQIMSFFLDLLNPLLQFLLELTYNRLYRIENSYIANSQLVLLVSHSCEIIVLTLPPIADYAHFTHTDVIAIKYKAINECCLLFAQIAPYLKNKANISKGSPEM